MKPFATALFAGLLLGVVPAAAQPATLDDASAAFKAGDYPAAEAGFLALTRQDSTDATAWYRLGYAYHFQKKYAEAAGAWIRADGLGFQPPSSRFNTARAYARLGRHDEAFAWLERALAAGFSQVDMLDGEADLEGLRQDARFAAVLEAADRRARPCHYSEAHRQFDFWVGAWRVMTPQGQQAGTNVIQSILNGCALVENWTSGGGNSGKSANFYDPAEKVWKQRWIDAGGNTALFVGTFTEGAMRFEGTWTTASGSTSLMTMTFTPLADGRVRQYIEQSLDGGQTWQPWFDGYYVRQGEGGD